MRLRPPSSFSTFCGHRRKGPSQKRQLQHTNNLEHPTLPTERNLALQLLPSCVFFTEGTRDSVLVTTAGACCGFQPLWSFWLRRSTSTASLNVQLAAGSREVCFLRGVVVDLPYFRCLPSLHCTCIHYSCTGPAGTAISRGRTAQIWRAGDPCKNRPSANSAVATNRRGTKKAKIDPLRQWRPHQKRPRVDMLSRAATTPTPPPTRLSATSTALLSIARPQIAPEMIEA